MSVMQVVRAFLDKAWAIPASIIVALVVSQVFPEFSRSVSDFGDLYLSFFMLAIIPFLSITIILSLANLVPINQSLLNLKKWLFVYVILYLLTSVSGILIAHFLNLGGDIGKEVEVSEIVRASKASSLQEIDLNTQLQTASEVSIMSFLVKSVPDNIFNALSEGTIVQIIVFSVLFGVAIGIMPTHRKKFLIEMIENFGEPFRIFIDFAILILPIGIFFIMSKYLSTLKDPTVLLYLWKYILVVILGIISLTVFLTFVTARKLKLPYFKSLRIIKSAAIISLSTTESTASIPSLLKGLLTQTKLHKDSVNLLVPMGISLFEFGAIFYYSFLTIFVAQLYNIPLDFSSYVIILIAVYFASAAETGIPLSAIPIIFAPLGLPLVFVTLFLVAIDWVTDPFRATYTVIANYAGSALTAENDEQV